jgi:excisionase family DNA binding protein
VSTVNAGSASLERDASEAGQKTSLASSTLAPAPEASKPDSLFLTLEEAAGRLRLSARTVRELTRTGSVPHRKTPGGRRCLFLPDELDAWMLGAELDVQELPRGGRVVRPRS